MTSVDSLITGPLLSHRRRFNSISLGSIVAIELATDEEKELDQFLDSFTTQCTLLGISLKGRVLSRRFRLVMAADEYEKDLLPPCLQAVRVYLSAYPGVEKYTVGPLVPIDIWWDKDV